MTNKNIIIYRDALLPYSETFIPAQVENYSRYTGFYVGNSRCTGEKYPLPPQRTLILSEQAKLTLKRKILFLLTGWGYRDWIQTLKQLSPQLIHAHFATDAVWTLPLKSQLNIPLIVTCHGHDVTASNRTKEDLIKLYGDNPWPQMYLGLQQRLFNTADCCIAVSEFIRNKTIARGCPADKIRVEYIGVDVEKLSPDPSIIRQPIVLFVGRLVEYKGCQYLIQAMAEVQSIIPELELVIIGDGEQRSFLDNQAARLLKRYQFLGVQPANIVKDWMSRSMLLCSPSFTDDKETSEGLPITILEAQAMNLPVIGSSHAGIPEAVIHGETGLLFPEKDSQALAQSIVNFAQNPQLREQCASTARKRIEKLFNLKNNIRIIETIYDTVIEKFQNKA